MTIVPLSGFEPISCDQPIGASLLASVVQSVDLNRLSAILAEVLEELRLPVTRAELLTGSLLRLTTARAEVLLTFCPAPQPRARFARANRPAGGEARDALALTRLERHRATISLSLRPLAAGADSPATPLTHNQGLSLVQRLIRHLSSLWPADLVVWEPSGTIYTISEFNALERRERVQPTRPRLCDLPPEALRHRRPEMVDLTEEPSVLAEVFGRLDRVLPKRPKAARRAPPPAPGTQAQAKAIVANALPHLPQAGHQVHARLKAVFRSMELPRDNALCEAKETSLPGRLAVYALNGSILVMAFPVGMSMLTYNVMKGESLTATARMMALTGIGMTLTTHTGLGALLPFL